VTRFAPLDAEAPLRSELEDDPDLAELLREFRGRLEDRAVDLEKAHERGDVERLRFVAHQLRGAGGSYGFPQITEAAEALERTMAPGELRALASLCRRASVTTARTNAASCGAPRA